MTLNPRVKCFSNVMTKKLERGGGREREREREKRELHPDGQVVKHNLRE